MLLNSPHPNPLPQVGEGRVFVLRPHPNPYVVKTKIEPTIITIVPIIFFVLFFLWNILNLNNSVTIVDDLNYASS